MKVYSQKGNFKIRTQLTPFSRFYVGTKIATSEYFLNSQCRNTYFLYRHYIFENREHNEYTGAEITVGLGGLKPPHKYSGGVFIAKSPPRIEEIQLYFPWNQLSFSQNYIIAWINDNVPWKSQLCSTFIHEKCYYYNKYTLFLLKYQNFPFGRPI